ncbi:cation diffusion facilitator family transporter [Brevundimonas diminuta]|uniref:Cation diffusion facilitator family transporter n=1 Tax=Brevundimonas diminuta TaxID=293 RepID=A0A2X1BQF5_BREDI|nr:cation diffusion facilitator family transporter [Brevundimonas diminuta]
MKTSNAEHDRQRRTLMIVLILNGLLFVGLGLGGLLANSSALLANALDNASDSLVYLISFLAVGRALAGSCAPREPRVCCC